MNSLSARQRNILKFIIQFFERNKFPPTIREIGDEVGISSTSVVNYNLAKLEEMDLVTRHREVSRGLSLNWNKLSEIGMGEPPLENVDRAAFFGAGRMRIPVLGVIAAGQPIMVEPRDQTNPESWIELAEGLTGNADNLFALRVKGNSMIDASVLDGDIVILRHQQTASDGDMVAAWIEGDEETTLKYFYRQGKDIRLQPANPSPEYQPIIKPSEMVRVNGKVVSVIRVYH
jgi:repressor LexA